MPTQPEPTDRAEVTKLACAVEEALAKVVPTAVRNDDPSVPSWQEGARIGTTPAVTDQSGARRPPMTQGAVDLNATLISTSVVITAVGGAASAILWASGHADPTVIAWVCACVVAVPAALAVPILAVKSLMKSAKQVVEAAPAEVHNHYNGSVHQDQRHTQNRNTAVWVKNTTEH